MDVARTGVTDWNPPGRYRPSAVMGSTTLFSAVQRVWPEMYRNPEMSRTNCGCESMIKRDNIHFYNKRTESIVGSDGQNVIIQTDMDQRVEHKTVAEGLRAMLLSMRTEFNECAKKNEFQCQKISDKLERDVKKEEMQQRYW